MGLRDYLPVNNETPLDTANRIRGQTLESSGSADVDRLVELFLNENDAAVCRAATKGICNVADHAPAELTDVVPQLLDATMIIEGPGAKQRGDLAAAVEAVARTEPEAIISHADLVVQSLKRELDADEQPGTDVRLYEDKAAALARTAGIARIERAEPILEKLAHHHHHEVSDAARAALENLENQQ